MPNLADITAKEQEILARGLIDLEQWKRDRPSDFYTPHEGGQRQFHESDHRFRFLFPGNRWGKTVAMGIEADMVLQGSDRFRKKRKVPAQVLWFAPQLRQFDVLKAQLDQKCLTQGYKFDANDNKFTWPNGSQMWVIPHDRDWKNIQGINPDMICGDEQPPRSLWNELQARSFGDRLTRYVIAATATEGISWMDKVFYKPWFDHHIRQGLDVDGAMRAQNHPQYFVWPKGGIKDNPSIEDSEKRRFAEQEWVGGAKEYAVRNGGGFQLWLGDCIFEDESLDWQRQRMNELNREIGMGRNGTFEVQPAA